MANTKHTCGGPSFGQLAAPGTCPRCDELRGGAKPRKSWGQQKRDREAATTRAIYAHDCKKSRCAIVCTFGDW